MDKEIVWSRMNLKEIVPELPSTLALSILVNSNRLMFIEQYKRMGYSLPENTEIIKVFYGRPYFNMNILLKTVSDFGSDPELLKKSLGGFQPDLLEGIESKSSILGRMKMLPAYIKTMLLLNNIGAISEKTFSVIRKTYEKDLNMDIRAFSDREILDYLSSIEAIVKERELTIIIGAGASVYYWYFREFLKKLVPGEELDNIINQLVTGSKDIISANQNLTLVRLAGVAEKDRQVMKALAGDSSYDRLEGTEFRRMIDDFLHEFGHRGLYETDIESPRYCENPDSVLNLIKNYIAAGATDPAEIIERQKKVQEDALEKVTGIIGKCRFSSLKKRTFSGYLKSYRHFLALREKNRYHTAMVFSLVRRTDLEIARRFAERGVLEKQHDIFFLTIPEIQSLLMGEKNDFKKIVNERKTEREKNLRIHAPDTIKGDAVPETVRETLRKSKKVFTGYAASPGIVQGKATIIHSPEEFGKFKAGEILVAPTTDPMWSTLFPAAKAVVTEMGGVLSHAAIVAREYGTPCVVNVQGIVDALDDGDLIEVDGKSGLVRIIIEERIL